MNINPKIVREQREYLKESQSEDNLDYKLIKMLKDKIQGSLG